MIGTNESPMKPGRFNVIRERDIHLMVEVGVFFGGSVLQWLDTSERLTVIGIDPWRTNWASYFEKNVAQYERHMQNV
jgi:hypothetical protein